MTPKLSDDLQKALDAHAGQPIRVEHPGTHAVYFLIDEETHRRAMQALKEQEDWRSVQQGLAERERRLGQPFAEVDVEIRKEFGFPPRP